MFWGRFGDSDCRTLQYQRPDGSPCLSGTEWEYQRRTRRPLPHTAGRSSCSTGVDRCPGLDATSPTLDDETGATTSGALLFFASQVNDSRRAPGRHERILDTRGIFASFFRQRSPVRRRSARWGTPRTTPVRCRNPAVWPWSPFPGLRPFTPVGRANLLRTRPRCRRCDRTHGIELDSSPSLVLSGSGQVVGRRRRSSFPRLSKLALPGVDRWVLPWVQAEPALAHLDGTFGSHQEGPVVIRSRASHDSSAHADRPLPGQDLVPGAASHARFPRGRDPWSAPSPPGAGHGEALLFIDQFEELFTPRRLRRHRTFHCDSLHLSRPEPKTCTGRW